MSSKQQIKKQTYQMERRSRQFQNTIQREENIYFIKLARGPADDPKMLVTFKPDSLEEITQGMKKRVGRPRLNWAVETLKELWGEAKSLPDLEPLGGDFDENKLKHVDRIYELTDRCIEKYKIKINV